MLFLGALVLALASAEDTPALPTLVPDITRAEIEHHLRTLASDAMQGRATGTSEAERAARYLADVLKGCGVQPAGDDGTYLQNVHFKSDKLKSTPTLEVETNDGSKPASVFGTDWRYPQADFEKRRLELVVARSAGEIPKTGLDQKALFLDEVDRQKQRDARSGAALTILPDLGGRLPRNRPTLALKGELLEAFRAGRIKSLTLEVAYEELPAFNVVGILPGAGEGAKKAVVLSAHYDHLAVKQLPAGETGDRIHNGADDDASGCSVVLELAGALAQRKPRAHSIVFLLATGEEIGLVGTNYQIAHPAVPLADTLANLNFEMLGRPDPLVGGAGKMWLTGWDETNLGPALVEAGIPIEVDKRPEEDFYHRSDNIAYVLKGVVGQTFSTYNLHKDYHKVSDEADAIDFEHLTSCARTALEAVELVVNGKVVPAFTPKPKR
jgi:hypothetical protein